MTTTIARQARIRFANATAPLAQLVINARFATIIADLIDELDADEHEFTCELCDEGTDYLYARLTEDYEEVEACEHCVDTYCLGYVAD